MIRGIHHVALATGQLERMISFYCDALGFEVVYRSGWDEGSASIDQLIGLEGSAATTAMLRTGTVFVELFEFSSPPARPGDPNRPVCDHGYTHFCLDVEDIDAECERLAALGMPFHSPPTPTPARVRRGSVRSVYGRDPDGNVIELLERLHPDSPLQPANGRKG
jgi:catechol 2,3-dioxygenase-like lactoylglutathione lyase family enzyme